MKDKKKRKSFFSKETAQTAMELGVFGSILLFMIGAIIKQVNSAGYNQNQQLKAMRWAMTVSERYSENVGSYTDPNNPGAPPTLDPAGFGRASRSSATVILIEDRLSTTLAKYGSLDRVPLMTMSAATHSNQLFFPVNDYDKDKNNLGVIDYFINGKHFVFTTGAFEVVCLTEQENQCDVPLKNGDPDPYPYDKWIGNGSVSKAQWWDAKCGTFVPSDRYACTTGTECIAGCPNFSAGVCAPWDPWLYNADDRPKKSPRAIQCAQLRKRVYNSSSKWCVRPAAGAPDPCDDEGNLSVDLRFDLDRSGTFSNPPDPLDFKTRQHFAWQWFRVEAFDESKIQDNKIMLVRFQNFPSDDVEGINISEEDQKNLSVDVDCDLKEESIIKLMRVNAEGVIEKVGVIDYQDGDIDGSINTKDKRDNPGLKNGLTSDATVWTMVKDGTTLLVEEGKLYQVSHDTKQYIRSARMNDQIDIIERKIQLSNDTKRFCSGGSPVASGAGYPGFWTDETPNPVEACCSGSDCCYAGGYSTKTCMDTDNLVIYVRSRIKEERGRKWITESRTMQ